MALKLDLYEISKHHAVAVARMSDDSMKGFWRAKERD